MQLSSLCPSLTTSELNKFIHTVTQTNKQTTYLVHTSKGLITLFGTGQNESQVNMEMLDI